MTPQIIIFDSPDGTGKTNIAQALGETIGVPYFKFNREHDYWRKGQFKTALEFDQPYLLQMLQQTHQDIIIDRAWPSEWVYSAVFGRPTNTELLEELDREYAKLGTWIVMPLRSSYEDNRDDEVVPADKLLELHKTYELFAEWTRCNVLRIYVDSYENVLERELDAINSAIDSSLDIKDTKYDITLRYKYK